jgi:plasmid maintenance system antidote protein VapI
MKRGLLIGFARMAGVGSSRMCDYLHGKSNARPRRAARLAKLTGTDIEVWLMAERADERRTAVEVWAASDVDGERASGRLSGQAGRASVEAG